ncbi:MAG: hypothetical protein JWR70_1819 [Modestobacter sp.]|nr:hypothetical protein [Modestobacter sp.]
MQRPLHFCLGSGSAIRPLVQELSGERARGRGPQLVAAIADR